LGAEAAALRRQIEGLETENAALRSARRLALQDEEAARAKKRRLAESRQQTRQLQARLSGLKDNVSESLDGLLKCVQALAIDKPTLALCVLYFCAILRMRSTASHHEHGRGVSFYPANYILFSQLEHPPRLVEKTVPQQLVL